MVKVVVVVKMVGQAYSGVASRLAGSKEAQIRSAPWAVCRVLQEAAVARSWAAPTVEETTFIRMVATEAGGVVGTTMGRS